MTDLLTARNLLLEAVFANQAHDDITVLRDDIPHPSILGFRQDVGEPHGQLADYRLTIGERCVHAKVYWDRYLFHWDKIDPLVNAIEHLRRDSPGYYTATTTSAGAALGAGVGFLLGENKESAAAGAAIGGLLGFLLGLATGEWD